MRGIVNALPIGSAMWVGIAGAGRLLGWQGLVWTAAAIALAGMALWSTLWLAAHR